jgi:hypothetical protein
LKKKVLPALAGFFHDAVINERDFQRWWVALPEPFADQEALARSVWQAAIEHERQACEWVCKEIAMMHRARYQGCTNIVDRHAMYDPYTEGLSDGASDCADAIRARSAPSPRLSSD